MRMRPWVLSAAIAVAALGAAVHAPPAQARGYVDVSVRVAPPPLRYERVPLRPGYVWAPGYWRWNGHRHVWVGGQYLRLRPGYVYVAPRWHRHGPGWRFDDGHWARR